MIGLLISSIVVIVALAIFTVTILPLLPSHAWWVRAWDFPRVQILILGLAVLAALPLVGPGWYLVPFAGLALACLYQAIRIAPYTPLFPVEMNLVKADGSDSQVRILSSNVEMGNDRFDAVAKLIADEDADLVFLMETHREWFDNLGDALAPYPTVVTELRENYYGMVFATRLKVHRAEIVYLTVDETPTLFAEVETRAGQRFRLVGLHPRPPVPGNTTKERDAEIIYAARFARDNDMPLIAVGDFNDAAWSDTSRKFKKVGGYLDPRVGRGMIASFDVKSRLLRAPIDQFYATPDIAVADFYRGPDVGSDHFPLTAVIELDPEKARGANTSPPEMSEARLTELNRVSDTYRQDLRRRHMPKED